MHQRTWPSKWLYQLYFDDSFRDFKACFSYSLAISDQRNDVKKNKNVFFKDLFFILEDENY